MAAPNVSGPPRLPVLYAHPEADEQLTKLLSNPKAKGRLGITGTMAHVGSCDHLIWEGDREAVFF